MKKLNLLVVLFLISVASFGQQTKVTQKPVSPKLQSLNSILSISAFDKTQWSLYGKYKKEEYAPIEAKKVTERIDTFLLGGPEDVIGGVSEFNLVKKYRKNMDTLFQEFTILGGSQLGEFFCTGDKPIRFCMKGDTALTLIVTGVFIDAVYNTLVLTSRERAARIITTYLIPELANFTKAFPGKEIKYFGISATYGSRDFSDKYSTDAEFVSIVSPVRLIKKYSSGNLTEDGLALLSDVYVSDRDMSYGDGVKKIKITIQ